MVPTAVEDRGGGSSSQLPQPQSPNSKGTCTGTGTGTGTGSRPGAPLTKLGSMGAGSTGPSMAGKPGMGTSMGLSMGGGEAAGKRKVKKTVELPLLRLVFTGMPMSGKSTFIKQLIANYIKTQENRQDYAGLVRGHVLGAIKELCSKRDRDPARATLPEEFVVQNANLDHKSMLTAEVGRHIEAVWKDPGLQQVYRHRQANAKGYEVGVKPYLDRIMDIVSPNYVPTELEILMLYSPTLRAEEIGMDMDVFKALCVEVSGKQRKHVEQWLPGAHAVFFVVDASDYKLMTEALDYFEVVSNSQCLEEAQVPLFLLLNKRDSLHHRLHHSGLKECFEDFEGKPGSVEAAMEFMQMKFESMYHGTQKLTTHTTCALELHSVLSTLATVRDFLQKGGVAAAPPPSAPPREVTGSKKSNKRVSTSQSESQSQARHSSDGLSRMNSSLKKYDSAGSSSALRT